MARISTLLILAPLLLVVAPAPAQAAVSIASDEQITLTCHGTLPDGRTVDASFVHHVSTDLGFLESVGVSLLDAGGALVAENFDVRTGPGLWTSDHVGTSMTLLHNGTDPVAEAVAQVDYRLVGRTTRTHDVFRFGNFVTVTTLTRQAVRVTPTALTVDGISVESPVCDGSRSTALIRHSFPPVFVDH